jgi:hypothetical protein
VLAVTAYPKDYIDDCRSAMEAQLAAYTKLTGATDRSPAALRSAIEDFEALFFNNLVLVLEEYFVHRTRAMEGKDGNPLNEVRMLCHSILHAGAVLTADKQIKYRADASVLKLEIGDRIHLDQEKFHRLFEAYFAELEKRFS